MSDPLDKFQTRRAAGGGGPDSFDPAAPADSFDFAYPEADAELKSLLESWRVPAAPQSLRSRVTQSFRQRFSHGEEEEEMKNAAGARDAFAPAYAFAAGARAEYSLTILEEEGLLARLAARVAEVARESELTLPEFKRDPLGFTGRLVKGYAAATRRAFAQENVGVGALAGLTVVLAVVCAAVALGWAGRGNGGPLARVREDLMVTGWVEKVPDAQPSPEATGAGMAKEGNGGGMKPKLEKPGGGGGGGRSERLQASHGKLPQASLAPQVLAPDPKPPVIERPNLPTAATLQADPVLFPPDTRSLPYGDPKSQASTASAGPGTGNGIGDGTGGGVGSGSGTGYGPGEGFNTGGGPPKIGGGGPGHGGAGGYDYTRTHKIGEVTRKAQIVSRPEPLYTEEARKNQITGTVVLRLVLNADGTVTNIQPVSRLPDGLTEKAIEAARRIHFTPAEKDGRKVSQYATIQYNFNIY